MTTADIDERIDRFIQVVHVLPGRTRFRLSWLHAAARPGEVERLADELTQLDGMQEVEIRPYTGRLLCRHDPERLGHAAILSRLIHLTGVHAIVEAGEAPPRVAVRRGDGPGEVAREVARLFKRIDDRILALTDGKLDMGTMTTFGFLGAGALNVALERKASAPPWFNLAWWSIRTFMLFEADAVADD